MLPTYRAPDSPPPSSPLSETSNLPDSSPITEPYDPDSESENDAPPPFQLDSSPRINPYSGSYYGSSKRTSNVLTPPVSPRKRTRRDMRAGSPSPVSPPDRRPRPDNLQEAAIWEDAAVEAFESKCFVFQLGQKDLTEIPVSFLKDLKSMTPSPASGDLFLDKENEQGPVVGQHERKFKRVHTAPSIFSRSSSQLGVFGPADKTQSSAAVLGKTNQNIELYLSNNLITKLPGALWDLRNITVLILRGNKLTYLPPEIGKLKNLVELNLANNRLRFIPSELYESRIPKLLLHPNCFHPRPEKGSVVGDTRRLFNGRVPPLTELALRRATFRRPPSFLSPEKATSKPKSILEQTYSLPLPQGSQFRQIPAKMAGVLATCIPGAVPGVKEMAEEDEAEGESPVTGVGICPNPNHVPKSIFVYHAEERFTWETRVAGERAGGEVPVRWRGCGVGCLDFLDEKRRESVPDADVAGEGGPVVVQLTMGPLGVDDFDP